MTDAAVLPSRRDPLDAIFGPPVSRDLGQDDQINDDCAAHEDGPGDARESVEHPMLRPQPELVERPAPAGHAAPERRAVIPAKPADARVADASSPPVRAAGTRSRAGNAMARTRAALLDGAARAVSVDGTGITMAQVASTAGVAKATLYNHFRTREAVLGALALAEVEALADEVTGLPLRHALVETAAVVATHPALQRLREREPGVLPAALAAPQPSAALQAARLAVATLLAEAGVSAPAAAELVLRWLFSLAVAPAAPADVLAAVDALLDGLRPNS